MITCMLISVFMGVEDDSLWPSCEASRSYILHFITTNHSIRIFWDNVYDHYLGWAQCAMSNKHCTLFFNVSGKTVNKNIIDYITNYGNISRIS